MPHLRTGSRSLATRWRRWSSCRGRVLEAPAVAVVGDVVAAVVGCTVASVAGAVATSGGAAVVFVAASQSMNGTRRRTRFCSSSFYSGNVSVSAGILLPILRLERRLAGLMGQDYIPCRLQLKQPICGDGTPYDGVRKLKKEGEEEGDAAAAAEVAAVAAGYHIRSR